jgi:hypothetical protein
VQYYTSVEIICSAFYGGAAIGVACLMFIALKLRADTLRGGLVLPLNRKTVILGRPVASTSGTSRQVSRPVPIEQRGGSRWIVTEDKQDAAPFILK